MHNKFTTLIAGMLALATLITGCTTTGQTFAGLTGAAIGSNIGGAIGAASGGGYGRWHHYNGRGAALGSLIGMGVGAALGVAIQKGAEENERRAYETEDDSYQTVQQRVPERLPVSISGLTYYDGNGDGCMSKGETIEVETYIQNESSQTIYDVDIVLDTQNSKYATVSSPLAITLEPNQKVRYSGRIYCRRVKSGRAVPVTISVASDGRTAQSETLSIYMK